MVRIDNSAAANARVIARTRRLEENAYRQKAQREDRYNSRAARTDRFERSQRTDRRERTRSKYKTIRETPPRARDRTDTRQIDSRRIRNRSVRPSNPRPTRKRIDVRT